jgi:hypothetical protein
MDTRTYSELIQYDSFEDRFEYLVLGGTVGRSTFGHDRYLNQEFYRSWQWKQVREQVIARDYGRDLGVEGFDIHEDILVHHMNPLSPDDIVAFEDWILDPEFLITTTYQTHNDIHYGNRPSRAPLTERTPGDTRLW